MKIEDRIARLERCLLIFAALATGQAEKDLTPDEVAHLNKQLGEDFEAMKNGAGA